MKLETLFILGPIVLVTVLFQYMPLITRPGLFFSATVDPGFPKSEAGRRLLRSYRLQAAIWAIAGCVLAVLLAPVSPAYSPLAPLLIAVGTVFSYYLKFREVHAHHGRRTPEVRFAELSQQPPRTFSLWLGVPPFVWLAGVAFYLQAHWDQLPERFPVHWGANGLPNGWATRSFQGVYAPLLLAAFLNVVFVFFAMVLLRASRNTTMRHVTVTILLLLMYPVSFAFGMVGLLPLTTFPMWIVPVVTLGMVAVLLVWSIMKITAHTAIDAVPEPQNDAYWKAGMFYYNPDDPAIFVSKRVGIGYTVNFANKISWLVMLGILLIVLLPALLLRPK